MINVKLMPAAAAAGYNNISRPIYRGHIYICFKETARQLAWGKQLKRGRNWRVMKGKEETSSQTSHASSAVKWFLVLYMAKSTFCRFRIKHIYGLFRFSNSYSTSQLCRTSHNSLSIFCVGRGHPDYDELICVDMNRKCVSHKLDFDKHISKTFCPLFLIWFLPF